MRCQYGDELIERYQENSTLQRKYGRPQFPEDADQEFLSSPATIDEKTKNSIRRRRKEMQAFAAQVGSLPIALNFNICLPIPHHFVCLNRLLGGEILCLCSMLFCVHVYMSI